MRQWLIDIGLALAMALSTFTIVQVLRPVDTQQQAQQVRPAAPVLLE